VRARRRCPPPAASVFERRIGIVAAPSGERAIYTGRVANFQAKRHDELAAVGDALGLLANLVMAWNTAQMQAAFDRLNARKSTAVPPELIGRIAPTRTEGINLRGVFRFPVEAYAEQLLPSGPRKRASGAR
jgi:hypothetical protein